MIDLKTVLLATDLSSYAPTLLAHAADLANQQQAQLTVVHAVEPMGNTGHALLNAYLKPETTHEITTQGIDSLLESVKTQVIDSLTDDHIEGYVDLKQLGQVLVEVGSPAEVILQTGEALRADVIIMGSHAPNGMITPQLGSVAQKVLNNSRIPVYFVPLTPSVKPPVHEAGIKQLGLW